MGTAVFLRRVVVADFGARVSNEQELRSFAANPPSSMYDVRRLLKDAQWICGGNTDRQCVGLPGAGGGHLWWINYAFGGLVGIALCGTLCTIAFVKFPKAWRKVERRWGLDEGSESEESDR